MSGDPYIPARLLKAVRRRQSHRAIVDLGSGEQQVIPLKQRGRTAEETADMLQGIAGEGGGVVKILDQSGELVDAVTVIEAEQRTFDERLVDLMRDTARDAHEHDRMIYAPMVAGYRDLLAAQTEVIAELRKHLVECYQQLASERNSRHDAEDAAAGMQPTETETRIVDLLEVIAMRHLGITFEGADDGAEH